MSSAYKLSLELDWAGTSRPRTREQNVYGRSLASQYRQPLLELEDTYKLRQVHHQCPLLGDDTIVSKGTVGFHLADYKKTYVTCQRLAIPSWDNKHRRGEWIEWDFIV